MSRTHVARSWILACGFAALAATSILFVTAPYGPGASGDSVTYLSVARSLADGEGWVRFDGRRYVAWPPLYPLALSAGIGAGLEPVSAARILGALAFAVTLVALVLTLARATGSLGWAAFGGLLALASPSVNETFATALSEGLFVSLMSVTFWLAVRAGPQPRPRDLFALGIVVGAACLTRYLGAVLATAVGAWLLVLPAKPGDRLRRVGLFGGVAVLGPAAWMLRNLALTGTPAGGRGGAFTPLARNAEQFATGLAGSLSLDALGAIRPWLAAAIVFGAVGLGLAAAWRARPGPPAVPALPAIFVLLYSLGLVALASWTPVSPLFEMRFAMPVWIPFVLLVGALGAVAWRRWPGRNPRIALAAVLALATGHGLAAAAVRAGEHRERGVHYMGRAEWHASGLIDAVRSRHTGATVLSNIPHGVHFHTGFPVDYAPRRHGFRSQAEVAGSLEALRRRVALEGSVPLAWFLVTSPGYSYYTPKELAAEGFCLLGRDRATDGIYFEITDPARCSGPRVVAPPGRGHPAGRGSPLDAPGGEAADGG